MTGSVKWLKTCFALVGFCLLSATPQQETETNRETGRFNDASRPTMHHSGEVVSQSSNNNTLLLVNLRQQIQGASTPNTTTTDDSVEDESTEETTTFSLRSLRSRRQVPTTVESTGGVKAAEPDSPAMVSSMDVLRRRLASTEIGVGSLFTTTDREAWNMTERTTEMESEISGTVASLSQTTAEHKNQTEQSHVSVAFSNNVSVTERTNSQTYNTQLIGFTLSTPDPSKQATTEPQNGLTSNWKVPRTTPPKVVSMDIKRLSQNSLAVIVSLVKGAVALSETPETAQSTENANGTLAKLDVDNIVEGLLYKNGSKIFENNSSLSTTTTTTTTITTTTAAATATDTVFKNTTSVKTNVNESYVDDIVNGILHALNKGERTTTSAGMATSMTSPPLSRGTAEDDLTTTSLAPQTTELSAVKIVHRQTLTTQPSLTQNEVNNILGNILKIPPTGDVTGNSLPPSVSQVTTAAPAIETVLQESIIGNILGKLSNTSAATETRPRPTVSAISGKTVTTQINLGQQAEQAMSGGVTVRLGWTCWAFAVMGIIYL